MADGKKPRHSFGGGQSSLAESPRYEGTQRLGVTCVPGAGDPQRGEGFLDETRGRGEAASYKTQGSCSEFVNTEPSADAQPDTALHTSSAKKGDPQQEMECDPSRDTGNPKQQRGEQPAQRTQPGNTREIFSQVTATLDKRRYRPAQIHEALSASPSLRVKRESSEEVEVTGSFTAMEILYRYLEGKEGRGEEAPPQQQENVISLPASLYEYFRNIHSAEIEMIKDKCNVDVAQHNDTVGNTVLTFTPRRGADCLIEKAKQLFTDKIQSIMSSDWTQRAANLPDASSLSITDIRQRVMERFHQTLVITEGDKVILRGPEKEVSAAQRYLEQGWFSSSPSRRAVTIETRGMADNLSVSASHLDFLKNLRSRDIRELEEKYSVKMEESRGGDQVRVSFRAVGGPPDLGPHALQMFLSLVQRTISNAVMMDNASLGSGKGHHHQRNHKQQPDGASGGSTRQDAPSETSRSAPPGTSRSPDGGASKDAEEPMDTSDSSSSANDKQPDVKDEKCPICLDTFTDKTILEKCKHEFCKICIEKCLEQKPVCPICTTRYGVVRGNQPDGTMRETMIHHSLPGYDCHTIQLDYHFSSGTQGDNHPNPGRPYHGTHRTAYLPDDTEGREILQLLRKAFDQRLVFTVGESRTTGAKDCVTWNDIHHKTSRHGGPGNFGYPDPQYLKRVRDELKAKGIE
uniref:E3 ubiquitin-protein ligase n=1 Tax=Leptobrachium leishanense TaxID=445787 RepID=A0A8C5WDI6_9ANUR